jgi:hypothetical protein
MRYELGFGKGIQPVEIDEKNVLDVLLPNPIEKDLTGEAEVRRALAAPPIGSAPLSQIVKPGEKIAIITSDTPRVMAMMRRFTFSARESLRFFILICLLHRPKALLSAPGQIHRSALPEHEAVPVHRDMGGFRIEGPALRKALRKVLVGQGTPRRLGRQTRVDVLQGGLQVNAGGLFLQEFYGTGNRNRAAAKGQDGRVFRVSAHRLLQCLLFQFSKPSLSIGGKNGRDTAAGFLDDYLVQVQERAAQGTGQKPPYRGFSGGHKACQSDEHRHKEW